MTKQTKQILIGIGVVAAGFYVYNKFIKKDDDFIIEGKIEDKPEDYGDKPVKQ